MTALDPQKKAAAVVPGSLAVLNGLPSAYSLPASAPESQRRLALAKWIVAADNPLTPRVLANRIWHYHFGTGIVDTPSDFGYMGGRPTHPELLDWLARQLVAGGWRLKPMHRLIMLSQAYRQASAHHEYAAAVVIDKMPDPEDLEALRAVTTLLAQARPDWRGDQAISLAEMWDE